MAPRHMGHGSHEDINFTSAQVECSQFACRRHWMALTSAWAVGRIVR